MDFSSVNWWAVLVCVVVSMVVGFVWFGPKTFFPIWWVAIGHAKDDKPGAAIPMGLMWPLTILSAFVQAVFIALMVHGTGSMMPGGATLASGALTGLIIWFGFVASTSLTNKLFAGQLLAWVLEAGNHCVDFVLFGAILGVWH